MIISQAPIGAEVRVIEINTDEKTRNRLQNIGIIAGCDVVLLQNNFGDVIVKVKDCRIALNKGVAKYVTVEAKDEKQK